MLCISEFIHQHISLKLAVFDTNCYRNYYTRGALELSDAERIGDVINRANFVPSTPFRTRRNLFRHTEPGMSPHFMEKVAKVLFLAIHPTRILLIVGLARGIYEVSLRNFDKSD